jgi:hypothetical protein
MSMLNKPPDPEDILFLDFEASSLSDDSYPIEIGWCRASRDSRPVSMLIQPTFGWTDWNYHSEAIHGISRTELAKHGQMPSVVASQFRGASRNKVVVSDAPAYDHHWMQRLAEATGHKKLAKIVDIMELLGATARPKVLAAPTGARLELFERIKNAMEEAKTINAARIHRAGPDAVGLRNTYLAFLEKLERL